MPVRSVQRIGLPGRITNPYYSSPQNAALSQNAAASQQQQVVSAGQFVPSSGLGSNLRITASTVKTPYGPVKIIFANGVPSISGNATFTLPFSQSQNGYNISGTENVIYTLHGNSLVPGATIKSGEVLYNGTPLANITNGNINIISGAHINIPVIQNNTNYGTITEVPYVSNGTIGFKYSSWSGNRVYELVKVTYTDPYTGKTYPVSYSWPSYPATYNPATGQISVTAPSMQQAFQNLSLIHI